MRINKFIAAGTGLSRRAADQAILEGRVRVNGELPTAGQTVSATDAVTLDGTRVSQQAPQTILLHKPEGYVVSRNGQGSRTIYDLLPANLRHLKAVGRLDKNSSGLLLMTSDGQLAQELTHPSYQKIKLYEIRLSEPLHPLHHQMVNDYGVRLEDGLSRLGLERLLEDDNTEWRVTMREGRNRQIRRTFASLGYTVTKLHRTQFGIYVLGRLEPGQYIVL